MLRRTLLARTAFAIPALALFAAGCASTTNALAAAQTFLTAGQQAVQAFVAEAGSEISSTAQADVTQVTGYLNDLAQLLTSAQGVITPSVTGSAANYIDLAVAVLTSLASLVPLGVAPTKSGAYAAALQRAKTAAATFHSASGTS